MKTWLNSGLVGASCCLARDFAICTLINSPNNLNVTHMGQLRARVQDGHGCGYRSFNICLKENIGFN